MLLQQKVVTRTDREKMVRIFSYSSWLKTDHRSLAIVDNIYLSETNVGIFSIIATDCIIFLYTIGPTSTRDFNPPEGELPLSKNVFASQLYPSDRKTG
jgi:hypothetical protein